MFFKVLSSKKIICGNDSTYKAVGGNSARNVVTYLCSANWQDPRENLN